MRLAVLVAVTPLPAAVPPAVPTPATVPLAVVPFAVVPFAVVPFAVDLRGVLAGVGAAAGRGVEAAIALGDGERTGSATECVEAMGAEGSGNGVMPAAHPARTTAVIAVTARTTTERAVLRKVMCRVWPGSMKPP